MAYVEMLMKLVNSFTNVIYNIHSNTKRLERVMQSRININEILY